MRFGEEKNLKAGLGAFAKVQGDVLGLILALLSPADWKNASLVCKFFYVRAHHPSVRWSVSQNFFPWLVERCREDFEGARDFIDVKELINFLMRLDIPIAGKISELNNLKSSINKEKTLSLGDTYFPKTLSKRFLLDEGGRALDPLSEFIDRLNSFLVQAFCLSLNCEQNDVSARFDEEVSKFYQSRAIDNPSEDLPEKLRSLLTAVNSQKDLIKLNNIRDLAKKVRPQYLRNYGINGIPHFKCKLVTFIISFLLTLVCGAVGGYIIGTPRDDYAIDTRFIVGMTLTGVGATSMLSCAFLIILYCHFRAGRNVAVEVLDRNVNNDPIIEVPVEPTERTRLFLPRQAENGGNNNNVLINEDGSAGVESEVEMKTDDESLQF